MLLGPGPPRHARPRWVTVALCCLVVAAAVGLWLHGGRDQPSTPPQPSAEQPTLLPPWDPKTLPPRGESVVDLSWLQASTDYALFVRAGSELYRVEARSGLLVRTTLPDASRAGALGSLVTVRQGAVIRGDGSMQLLSVADDGPPRAFRHGEAVLPGPDRHHVWVQQDGSSLTLVGADGTATRTTIRLPSDLNGPIRPDGQGYVLVRTPKGVYDLRPHGRRLVTKDGVVATGRDRLLIPRCAGPGSAARCRLVLLDGELRELHPVDGLDLTRLDLAEAGMPMGVISPDHRFVALARAQDNLLQLIDLTDGSIRDLDLTTMWWVAFAAHSVLAFSPDSRWLFTIDDDQHVAAIKVLTGTIREILPGAFPVGQIAVRP